MGLLDYPPMTSTCAAGANHLVRFFTTDKALADTVSDFVAGGFALGERAVVAATPARAFAIRAALKKRGHHRLEDRVSFVCADQAAEAIAKDGKADRAAFKRLVAPVVAAAAKASANGRARVYGEIVDVLWHSHREDAAADLESFWTAFGKTEKFTLLCGYKIDPFDRRRAAWDLVESHDSVLPCPENNRDLKRVESALERALGSQAGMVRSLVQAEPRLRGLPFAQAAMLWLGRHMPILASKVAAETIAA